MTAISAALQEYNNKTGSYPEGDTKAVLKALSDNTNSQGHAYLVFNRVAGHLYEDLDPWGTPYQIEIFGQTNFIICSAGKNMNFGDKDDIVFNSISNDFVKP